MPLTHCYCRFSIFESLLLCGPISHVRPRPLSVDVFLNYHGAVFVYAILVINLTAQCSQSLILLWRPIRYQLVYMVNFNKIPVAHTVVFANTHIFIITHYIMFDCVWFTMIYGTYIVEV